MNKNAKTANFLNTLKRFLPEATLAIAFCYLQLKRINIDFWNDEIYTLKHFTFSTFSQTLTDYHVPNNHIFFNLLNNIYLKLINIDSLELLMDAPYKLRIIPLIYAALTLLLTYRFGIKFFNRFVGLLTVCILIFTIPYFNYALQIRGYGISTLLLLIIVYSSCSYLINPKNKYLAAAFLGSALIIYTIPSNIYPLLCLLLFLGIYFIKSSIKTFKNKDSFDFKIISKSEHFKIILVIIIGIGISLLMYLPIFRAVFMNEYVVSSRYFKFDKVLPYFGQFLPAMISGRWLLLALSLIGLVFKFKREKQQYFFLFLLLVAGPIFLSLIRGDSAPLRVFLVSAPFFALLFAVGLLRFRELSLKNQYRFDSSIIPFVLVYSLFAFNRETKFIENHLLTDIKEEKRSQSLYYQYYSHHYQPLKDISAFKKLLSQKSLPVHVHGCEPHGVSNYLVKFDIPSTHKFFQPKALDSLLLTNDSIYIITNHPSKIIKNGYESKILNEELTYHNVLLFYKKED